MELEVQQLSEFLNEFNKENDRGAALLAAVLFDERLLDILKSFLINCKTSEELLDGFNAPLGTFSSRIKLTYSLGLINQNEYDELEIIRKIRNDFGHKWKDISFENNKIAELCAKLPWRGPVEYEHDSTPRQRFNSSVSMLLVDLMWRSRLVEKEKRLNKKWGHTARIG